VYPLLLGNILSDMTSKKVQGADDQQERLIKIGWITGYVDGEGCFSVGFIRQPDRSTDKGIRRGYRTGYQVFHEFAVTQGAKSIASLRTLREYFKIGNIYPNRRYDNHKEHLYRFVVRKRSDLLQVIIPFFRRYPMRTTKQADFEKFARCVLMVDAKQHLTSRGVIRIAKIAATMNRQKPRESLIRILRDHTPKSATSR
jgi:hypothetical protein